MIEKLLDKYYAKKLIDKLSNDLMIYYIDKRIKFNKDSFHLEIKYKKFDEEYYNRILILPYNECFDILVNRYEDFKKQIINIVEKILKKSEVQTWD